LKKNFVLDTNVLLHDPNAVFAFEEHNVIIPIYVIEEVDQFKRDLSELGRSAREVGRTLDHLRHEGSLGEGVALPNGGMLRVTFTAKELPHAMQNGHQVDNRILAMALDVREAHPDDPTILVTKDVNLRIRADALGLYAEDYDVDRQEITELYTGMVELEVPGSDIDAFYAQGSLPLPDPYYCSNQFVHLKDTANPSHSALGKVSLDNERIVPITRLKEGVWGVRPRNKEQSFALDLLMDDNIKLVTLVGKAGTGKTLLAIAVGLQKATEEAKYPARPRVAPHLAAGSRHRLSARQRRGEAVAVDAADLRQRRVLAGPVERAEARRASSYRELIDLGILQIEPLTYIRGRSIPQQFMIVDEAQNLTPHEVKTIVSRAR
jgi:PhoH-like ATPase